MKTHSNITTRINKTIVKFIRKLGFNIVDSSELEGKYGAPHPKKYGGPPRFI